MTNKKTILITGARGGIGRDTAIALAKNGHKVIATVHRQESVAELKKYATEQNVSLDVFKLDITLPEDRKLIVSLDFDVLINNAAIGESGPLSELPPSRLRSNFETNVFGSLELSQIALDKMLRKDNGRIIFISSVAGRIVMPYWGSYNMTKFALTAAAEVMRQEIAEITKNVFISIIEPGTYHTGFNQRVMATKYQWLDEYSNFYNLLSKIRQREEWMFDKLELQSTESIVKRIVKSVESEKPCLRYYAPLYQAFFVQLFRIFGK